jgi:hypothetical protein
MKIVDYFFIHLYAYFSSGAYKLVWSTAQSWTIYVMSIGVLLWAMVVEFALIDFAYHDLSPTYRLITLFIAGIFYLLFNRRYIIGDRYLDLIAKHDIENDTTERIVSIAVVMILPVILIGILAIIRKPLPH